MLHCLGLLHCAPKKQIQLKAKTRRRPDQRAQVRMSSADPWERCDQSMHGLLQTAAKRCPGPRRHRRQGLLERPKPREFEMTAAARGRACHTWDWGASIWHMQVCNPR